MTTHSLFRRHIAVLILLSVGVSFASAHIAARVSFDNGTGLLTAVIFRSSVCLLLLASIALWRKQSLRLSWRLSPWQLGLGLMIAIQSVSIYSAVSRIPVGIALLVVNTFPVQLALLTWALGGKPPTKKTAFLMTMILVGLLLVLDIPHLMQTESKDTSTWIIGISSGFLAAFAFAIGMWITENRLQNINGSTRSFYTMLTVIIMVWIAGQYELIPGGLSWPDNPLGWSTLLLVSALYATGFTTLFMLAPRLNLAQNAPAMNIEPVASLTLGWVILGQQLNTMQIAGGTLVVACIVAFSYAKSDS